MKTPTTKFLTIIFLMSILVISSCSKDKKIERALHKKEGEWNITTVNWQKVSQSSSGQSVTLGTTSNAGTFTFEKDGSGKYSFVVDGSSYSQSFDWSVNEEVISITKVSQTVDFSGNFDQLAVAISGTQSSKNNIELEGSETHQYSSGPITQHVIVGSFSLTKK